MVSGKEKAVALMAALGEKADLVMRYLSPQEVTLLQEGLKNRPDSSSGALELALSQAVKQLSIQVGAPESSLKSSSTLPTGSGSTALDWDLELSSSDGFDDLLASPEGDLKDEYAVAAERLKEQPEQLIAFFLSKLDEKTKEGILTHFDHEMSTRVLGLEVESMPAADFIYAKMKQSILGSV